MTESTCCSRQRRSVFPPLLGVEAERRRSVHESGINKRGTSYSLDGRPRARKTEKHRLPEITGVERETKKTARNQRDVDLQRKREIKAEALVKKWDLLLVREKEDKHAQLLQRLELQHRLIAKNDLLSKLAMKEAEEKRTKELQSRRDFQKQMIQSFRAHNQRINEHKKMVERKFRETRMSRPTSHMNAAISPELRDLTEEATPNQPPSDETGTCSSPTGRTSRLQRLLNYDPIREATPTIPNAWATLKHNNERRMQPFVEYSLHMRKFANPTSERLLRYYDQPVRVNSKSGERVPLLETFEKEYELQQTDSGAQRLLTKALELKARRNQMRAEVLLHRKQTQVNVPLQEPTMYLPKEEYEFLERNTACQGLSSFQVPVDVRHFPTNDKTKKRLSKFLTQDDDPVSASSEEVSDRVYHRPKADQARVRSTTVLADGAANEQADTNRTLRWQPLSSSAAQEYKGTCVVPVTVFSTQGHGKYSMWKPLSSHTCTAPT